MTAPTMDERRAVARRMREYKCPVLPSHQTTREAVDAVVECMGLENDDKMCTVRHFLDRLADLIDPGDDTTMSAYDLLPEDGRDALDWVREHGGLGQVKMDYTMGECFTDLVDRIAAKLGVNVEGLDAQDSEPFIMDAIDRRMMPEGMEWPRFEDGEPVRFLDDFERYGDENGVSVVTMYSDGSFALNFRAYSKGERVRRPAPKVLDADGVEIRDGDTVWDEHGDELAVLAVYGQDVHCRYAEYEDQICDNGTWEPLQLTHRAPVLAADGKPLRVGDTVWCANGDSPQLKVARIESDRVVTENARDGEQWWAVYILTHEQPDSWERLEEDAGKEACEYFAHMPCGCETSEMLDETVEKCNAAKARDLVRRARALAERERGQ